MSQMAPGVSHDTRPPLILGAILILIGVAGLVRMAVPSSGGVIVLMIGIGMLALFAMTRAYGWLIPGCIVTGLGAGIVAQEYGPAVESGALIVGGLGLGFISIWVLGALFRVKEQHAWPLVPGTILVTVAVGLWLDSVSSLDVEWWPMLLIVIGLIVIGAALTQRRST